MRVAKGFIPITRLDAMKFMFYVQFCTYLRSMFILMKTFLSPITPSNI